MGEKKPINFFKNLEKIRKNRNELYYRLQYYLAKERWYNKKKLLKGCLNKKWDKDDLKWINNWNKRDLIVEYLEQSSNPYKKDYEIWLRRKQKKENSKPKKNEN